MTNLELLAKAANPKSELSKLAALSGQKTELEKLASTVGRKTELDKLASLGARPKTELEKLAFGIHAYRDAAQTIFGGSIPKQLKNLSDIDLFKAAINRNPSKFIRNLTIAQGYGIADSRLIRTAFADQYNQIHHLTGASQKNLDTLFPMADIAEGGGRRLAHGGDILSYDPQSGRYINKTKLDTEAANVAEQARWARENPHIGGGEGAPSSRVINSLEEDTRARTKAHETPGAGGFAELMKRPWAPYAAGAGGMMILNNQQGRGRGY